MREFRQNFSAFTSMISFITVGLNLAGKGQARDERGGKEHDWREMKGWLGRGREREIGGIDTRRRERQRLGKTKNEKDNTMN